MQARHADGLRPSQRPGSNHNPRGGVYEEPSSVGTAQIQQPADRLPRRSGRQAKPISEELSAHVQRVARLFDTLTRDLPAEPKDRSPAQAALWLLAHALDWHRREEKVKWWEYYPCGRKYQSSACLRQWCPACPTF